MLDRDDGLELAAELDFWRREATARVLGLGQLRRLRTSAVAHIARVLADPESALEELYILSDKGYVDAEALVPGSDLAEMVVGYYEEQIAHYDACIGDYERELREAQRVLWAARPPMSMSTAAPAPLRIQQRPRERRARVGRGRARSPGRQADDPELAPPGGAVAA